MTVGIIVHRNSLLTHCRLTNCEAFLRRNLRVAWRGGEHDHVWPYATEPITPATTEIGRSSLKYAPLPDHRSVILKVARDPAAIGFVV